MYKRLSNAQVALFRGQNEKKSGVCDQIIFGNKETPVMRALSMISLGELKVMILICWLPGAQSLREKPLKNLKKHIKIALSPKNKNLGG